MVLTVHLAVALEESERVISNVACKVDTGPGNIDQASMSIKVNVVYLLDAPIPLVRLEQLVSKEELSSRE
jgi:hypothetical protein